MMKFRVLILVFALTACVSAEEINRLDLKSTEAHKAYVYCGFSEASKLKKSKEDPALIAQAALANCARKKIDYLEATEKYMIALSGHKAASLQRAKIAADKAVDNSEKFMKDQIISLIIKDRLK